MIRCERDLKGKNKGKQAGQKRPNLLHDSILSIGKNGKSNKA